MGNSILGIDIGSSSLKLALCRGSKILRLAEEPMPDSLLTEGRIVSPEAMAAFLKESVKKNKLHVRRCAVILPASQVFVRQTELPFMTAEHLKLNLPYEFRDFISDDRDKYFYDYYVVNTRRDDKGQPVKLELVAAAARKELIARYNDLCRWAGLKLMTAIPAEMALVNLIRRSHAAEGVSPQQEQCFIDLGHTGTRIYFFNGDRFDAVRSAERGGAEADSILAEQLNVDVHIARTRKESNADGELDHPSLGDVYRDISTDIMRAVNFYSYNNPSSELDRGWFCGGGSRIAPLCDEIGGALNIQLAPITGLVQDSPDDKLSGVCFAAIGAAMQ